MFFALIKEPEQLSWYGDVPNVPLASDDTAEVHVIDYGDWHLFHDGFVSRLNDACGSVLDMGDLDYFCGPKLEALDAFLQANASSLTGRLGVHCERLAAYVAEASRRGTGVVIEM